MLPFCGFLGNSLIEPRQVLNILASFHSRVALTNTCIITTTMQNCMSECSIINDMHEHINNLQYIYIYDLILEVYAFTHYL